MRRRLFSAVFAAWLVILQPALVQANAYSLLTYSFTYIEGHVGFSDFCYRAGLVAPVQNYGFVWNQPGGPPNNCGNGDKPVGVGEIGPKVLGYRDGQLCGESGYFTNTQTTAAWQVWVSICTNPAGNQQFWTGSAGEGLLDKMVFPWKYRYTTLVLISPREIH